VIFHRMNFINAEITKISVNAYVTTKISYANMLAEVCETMPGADVDVVTDAVGSDSRIGKKYLKGAIGFGGPCFPRDNKAFTAFGAEIGIECALATATDVINERQLDRLEKHVQAQGAVGSRVCVLGLAYKTDTGEIDESQGIALCLRLAELGYVVSAHDPMAGPLAQGRLNGNVKVYSDYKEAISGSQVTIIMTPWSTYKAVMNDMQHLCDASAVLIDPWRMFSEAHNSTAPKLVLPGKHQYSS